MKLFNRRNSFHRSPARHLSAAVCLFFFSAFVLLALKDYSWQTLAMAFCVPLAIRISVSLIPRIFPADQLLLSLTSFLCGLGILVLYSTNQTLAWYQCIYYGIGMGLMILCIYLVRLIQDWKAPVILLIPLSLVLLCLPLFLGKLTNGARNWIYISGVSLQPSEIVKLSLLVILAYLMSHRKTLLWLLFLLPCLALLMLQRDLGTALLYFGTALLMAYCASGSLPILLLGLAGGAGGSVLGYRLFAHVKKRVAVWRNPWADYENAGYQIVQGLIALASGGLWGTGLGLGSPKTIPVYHTDYIFAVICEQFGLIFGLCVLAVYIAMIWRGATIAMAARHSFHGLLAMGCTILLAIQTFTIIGGVIKLIPLTGVTMPFVSYGGTSMLCSLCLIGLLQGVASLNENDLQQDIHMTMIGGGR